MLSIAGLALGQDGIVAAIVDAAVPEYVLFYLTPY
jgi:hypothetical protein